MASLTPYLFFNGNCREAMEFYQSCFGGKLDVMTYAEAPTTSEGSCTEGEFDMEKMKDKLLHACLMSGDIAIMASDTPMGHVNQGDGITININADSIEHVESLFQKLSAGGKPTTPPHDAFWGSRFAMLTDKYGFNWMLNTPLKK